ncbi:hypothetical protein [Leptothermofonsia sp. ETS-13]
MSIVTYEGFNATPATMTRELDDLSEDPLEFGAGEPNLPRYVFN